MENTEVIEAVRAKLFAGDEEGFISLLISMKEAGISQRQVYDCLVELWDRLDVKENDAELDRLSNWITTVMGRVAPQYRIWDDRL